MSRYPKTHQEMFNILAEHLISQGTRSTRSLSAGCVYRTSAGLKCGVGCFILDEDYREWMDEKGSTSFMTLIERAEAVKRSDINPELLEFLLANQDILYQFQQLHDSINPFLWPIALMKMVIKMDLEIPSCLDETNEQIDKMDDYEKSELYDIVCYENAC